MIERDESHRYWNVDATGREELIGVTRTLVESNLIDDSYFSDLSRGRGKLVHYFCERLMTKTPLTMGIHESVAGYLVGLRKFLDRMAPEVTGTELIKGNTIRKLAGGIDLAVVMQGGPGVIEIKTSAPSPWHRLQLAPYAYLLDGKNWIARARWGLYLTERGGFKLKEYDDHTDLDYFLRAHELLMWRCRHGTTERPFGRRSRDTSTGIAEPGYERSDPDGDFAIDDDAPF